MSIIGKSASFVVALGIAFGLAACGEPASEPQASPSTTNIPATTPTSTKTTTSAAPRPVFYVLQCYDGELGKKVSFGSLEEAWGNSDNLYSTGCEAKISGDLPSETEEKALQVAYNTDDHERLDTLYEICAATEGFYYEGGSLSPNQAQELSGAFLLCPDHPFADNIQASLEISAIDAQLVEENKLIQGDGSYLVGSDIASGTYETVADRLEGCYWELSDASGNILDNNFISIAPKVTVNVSGAAGFTTDGCGEWRWIG